MRATLDLPVKDKAKFGEIVRSHVAREERNIQDWITFTSLATLYMAGCRKFNVYDPRRRVVVGDWTDENGDLEYQDNTLVMELNKILGVMNSQDVRPKVERVGASLGDIRNRAVAQILMETLLQEQTRDQIDAEFNFMLAAYGCAALSGAVERLPVVGLVGDIEVVHGTELMQFPSRIGPGVSSGIMRRRWVSEDFLREKFSSQKVAAMLKSGQYRGRSIQWGEAMDDQVGTQYPTYYNQADEGRNSMRIFEIVEVYNIGINNLVKQYGVVSGRYTLEAYDFSQDEVYCPIAKATFYNNGTFHGMGHFQMRFASHRATERLMQQLYQGTEEVDRYPLLVLPQGSYNGRTAFKDSGGVKIMKYMPDAYIENFRPFQVEPINTVGMKASIAEFSRNASRELTPIRDLLAEKGRAESGEALQFLDEQTKQATVHATQQKRMAYGQAYLAVAQAAIRELIEQPSPLYPARLSIDMAGVVIDPENDSVTFSDNPVPNISKLKFTIMDGHPQSSLARKMEATNHVREGRMTIDEYRVFMAKEGLDPAMLLDAEVNAVELATRNCLTVFGDGEVPGQIVLTPDTVRPDVQLMIVSTFMGSLAVAKASPQVQDALSQYKRVLTEFGGFALPEQVPAGTI